jgi:hypothetical protein
LAKRAKSTQAADGTSGHGIIAEVETQAEAFAEDLGRLLGTARAKADSWIGQRTEITKTLSEIRDTATKLLSDLGHQAERVVRRGRQTRAEVLAPPPTKKQRRKLSAKARKAIAAAQKKRWAAYRAAQK